MKIEHEHEQNENIYVFIYAFMGSKQTLTKQKCGNKLVDGIDPDWKKNCIKVKHRQRRYESFSDVGESGVWFASKNLTPLYNKLTFVPKYPNFGVKKQIFFVPCVAASEIIKLKQCLNNTPLFFVLYGMKMTFKGRRALLTNF